MKLNKPVITICLIILLAINLLFFSFLSIGNKLEEKEFVNSIINSFDFKDYLLKEDNISTSINNYRYPQEVFDYLDDIKIKEIKDKIINDLFDNKEMIIEKGDIKELLVDSVYEFQNNRNVDIFNYVSSDIESFSLTFSNKINGEFVKSFYDIRNFSSWFYSITLLLTVIMIGLIIYFEKQKGLLISSIILMTYSFFAFYFNKYFLKFVFKNQSNYLKNVKLDLDSLYIISFIIGFIILIIYLIKVFKKVARDIRISSYNRR